MTKKIVLLLILFLHSIPLFAQSVDTAWVRRYNGPGNSSDYPRGIVVDDSGNVYVTGKSEGIDTEYDYATIKYDVNGNQLWGKRYSGEGNYAALAYAIALDGSGNIYVTGGSMGSSSYDYTTIKYYPDGDTAWVRRYHGPENYPSEAYAVATDDSGYVYVTGTSYGGTSTDLDCATVKYDPDGYQVWARRYNGSANYEDQGRSITVDDSGNVYVTARSDGLGTESDYVTIKYHSNGDTAWVRRYNGTANGSDLPDALAVDDSGNVYVTGWSFNTGTGTDYTTIKYNSNGDTLWVRQYSGPGNGGDQAYAMALDVAGNVYVTGGSYKSGIGDEYATIKYYPNGDTAWVRRYHGPGDFGDDAVAIKVEGCGNIFVTGTSYGIGTGTDYATIKYNPDGVEIWIKRYDGPANGWDGAKAITVDSCGNVYVTGSGYGIGTGTDYATLKYVQFLRGDANQDDIVDIVDVVYLVIYVLKSGSAPVPIPQVGNVNCDDVVDITDAVYLVNHLFKSGPPPCE